MKEMCIDFRRNRTVISPIVINCEHVNSFKYLDVVLDKKLSFTEHVTAVQEKSQQRLQVLRKWWTFNVDPIFLLCRVQWLTGRASDYRLREPGFKTFVCCGFKTLGNFFLST